MGSYQIHRAPIPGFIRISVSSVYRTALLHTVHQNLASLPRVMTAPSESGPSSFSTVRNALIISWQYQEFSRFSGGFCIVRTNTFPCLSSERLRNVGISGILLAAWKRNVASRNDTCFSIQHLLKKRRHAGHVQSRAPVPPHLRFPRPTVYFAAEIDRLPIAAAIRIGECL